MSTKLSAQVEQLIEWRIKDLQGIPAVGTPTVEEVTKSLARGAFNHGRLPSEIPLLALQSFRKRSDQSKRILVGKVFQRLQQGTLPTAPAAASTAPPPQPETLPASVSAARPEPAAIVPVRSDALGELARRTSLELIEHRGEVYITLRAFEQLIGKRPDNLRRTLEARGFPIVDVQAKNERGQDRETPAVLAAYIFAVVGLADLHGMDAQERNHLFNLQTHFPTWMKRFDEMTRPRALAAPVSEEPRGPFLVSLSRLGETIQNRLLSIVTSGLGGLRDHFNVRFDSLEAHIDHLLESRTTQPNGTTAPATPAVAMVRNLRLNGIAKISSRPPVRDVKWVTENINQRLQTFFTPYEIIRMAERERIYNADLWGMDKIGVEDAVVLDGGERVTWFFDQDAIELLHDVARRETVARNSAPST